MNTNIEGKKIPEITFKTRSDNQWKDLTTKEIFENKKVIVFCLPGAFTPTCSTAHLPRYDELAPVFKANGIDDIYCLSVNDTFVMNAWASTQKIKDVKMIPDGNGDFSDAIGLLVDKAAIGFGKRSWRYSMLVNNGVVEKAFIEPDKAGDPYEVSDADTMLNFINPKAIIPPKATIITKEGCPHCTRAKALLEKKGITYEELVIGKDLTAVAMRSMTKASTTPQIFLNEEYIGGADQLEEFFAKNKDLASV
jgi:glutathione-dependent peroxiredoxin